YMNFGASGALYYQASTRTVVELASSSIIMGAEDSTDVAEEERALSAGDVLLIVTDGVFEAPLVSGARKRFGLDRVKRLLAANAVKDALEIVRRLNQRLTDVCVHRSQRDDVTIVAIKILAGAH